MLAFSNDYYGMIFRATQSVELFCAYVEKTHKVIDVDKRILLKALRQFPVYDFARLKSYFPLLKSLSEFLLSKDYAGRYEFVTITSGEPTNEDIYQGALRLFEILSNKILSKENHCKVLMCLKKCNYLIILSTLQERKNIIRTKLNKKREKEFLKILLMLMQLIVMIYRIKIGLYIPIIKERQKKNVL